MIAITITIMMKMADTMITTIMMEIMGIIITTMMETTGTITTKWGTGEKTAINKRRGRTGTLADQGCFFFFLFLDCSVWKR
jgi:hypothetical protein